MKAETKSWSQKDFAVANEILSTEATRLEGQLKLKCTTMPERPSLNNSDTVANFDAMSAYVAKLQSLVNLTAASVSRPESAGSVPTAASAAASAAASMETPAPVAVPAAAQKPTQPAATAPDTSGKNKSAWNPDAAILEARGVKSLEELNSKNFVVPD